MNDDKAGSKLDYEILRLIGRGAYGEVYLARDASGAYCAVKVISRETFENDRPFEREYEGLRKFQLISRSYDNQVQVFSVGREEEPKRFYYIMELADDIETGQRINPETYTPRTLRSELIRRGRLPPKECASIGVSLARALESLHENGLIHRDIKPANIIFVQDRPKLADIGLITDAAVSISHVGTEGFIPPEGPSSPRSDIYSLGKVLYEMCTGRDRMDFPELPTDLQKWPDKEVLLELNVVIAKACERDPRRRYPSAREMSADLVYVQRGLSVRRRKALRRKLRLAAWASLLLALGGVVAIGAYRSRTTWPFRTQPNGSGVWPPPPAETKDLTAAKPTSISSLLVASPAQAQADNCVPRPAGLIGWWGGDDNARDQAGTNDGTLLNGAIYGPGRVGRAFWFNGQDQFVILRPGLVLGSRFTEMAWILPRPADEQFHAILGSLVFAQIHLRPPSLWICRTNLVYFGFGNGQRWLGGRTAPTLVTGVWNHVAVVFDGEDYHIYVNGLEAPVESYMLHGQPVSSPIFRGQTPYPNPVQCIGKAGRDNFPGLVDEVAIFDRPLSGREIAAIYAAGAAGICRGPSVSVRSSNSVPVLQITGQAGQTCGIQFTLTPGNPARWQGLTNVTLKDPTEAWLDLQSSSHRQASYRAVPGPISIP